MSKTKTTPGLQPQPKRVKTSKSEIARLIKTSSGKFITVTFGTKKNPMRTMNCVFPKNLGDNPAKQLGHITVMAVKEKEYRNIDPRKLQSAKIAGVEYYV